MASNDATLWRFVSLVIVRDGQVAYHQAFGVRNTLTRQPVEDKTLFEAASITKAVFAFAATRLAERGVVDLDAPLSTVLPFPNISGDPRSKKLTARMVLSHRTGLPNWAWGGPGGWENGGDLELEFEPVGLGFFLEDTPWGQLVGHGGNNGDFDCKFGIVPEKGVGYAAFTNGNVGDEFLRALEIFLLQSLNREESKSPGVANSTGEPEVKLDH